MLNYLSTLTFVVLLLIACEKKPQTYDQSPISNTKKSVIGKKTLPHIRVKKNNYTTVKEAFSHSVGGKPVQEKTIINITYNETFLVIQFECKDNPRVDQNYYSEDNTPLFHQEVFELFIAAGEEAPENYLELQINPNNALFIGRVTNKYKSDKSYHFDKIDAENSMVEREVIKLPEENLWKGVLKIPLILINETQSIAQTYRLNMFRIISKKDQKDKAWKGNTSNATYACWNSTLSKKPNFHRPDYFGYLHLE